MTTYVYRPDHLMADKRGFVEKSSLHEEKLGESPNIISDVMEPTRHMATGRTHTSKSEFRKDTKRSGCVEVGNDVGCFTEPRRPVVLSRRDRAESIKEAINYLRNR